MNKQPVAVVGDGRGQIVSERLELPTVEQRRPAADDEKHEKEGRKEPSGAAQPELTEIDAVALAILSDEQVRDQIAGQHEEDPDAKQASSGPAGADVKGDDTENGDRPDAVESPEIRPRAFNRLRHRSGRRQLETSQPTP